MRRVALITLATVGGVALAFTALAFALALSAMPG